MSEAAPVPAAFLPDLGKLTGLGPTAAEDIGRMVAAAVRWFAENRDARPIWQNDRAANDAAAQLDAAMCAAIGRKHNDPTQWGTDFALYMAHAQMRWLRAYGPAPTDDCWRGV